MEEEARNGEAPMTATITVHSRAPTRSRRPVRAHNRSGLARGRAHQDGRDMMTGFRSTEPGWTDNVMRYDGMDGRAELVRMHGHQEEGRDVRPRLQAMADQVTAG